MKPFKSPKKTLGALDAEAASRLVASAADVALIIDRQGVIRDIASGGDEPSREGWERWVGRAWVDTVTAESRPKIEALLRDADGKHPQRWRQVNHPSHEGDDVPVLYSAIQVAPGRIVAVGRDLRAIAALQRRLLDAQQSVEREYARLRNVETRYRLIFQMTSEAVLVIDPATLKVTEANPAAVKLLGEGGRRIVGRPFPEGFDSPSTRALESLLSGVRTAGRADEVRARLADGDRDHEFLVSASMLRQDQSTVFLVRLVPLQAEVATTAIPRRRSLLLAVAEASPDALVLTAPDGRILAANRAFLELTQLVDEDHLRGESLDRWLGRPGVDASVLITNLRQHGSVRSFATTFRGEYGFNTEVEISAVRVSGDGEECFGFAIRDVRRRQAVEPRAEKELPRSVGELTELIGRVALKDIVRETTDVIERLSIEAALELTGDNRASAAEMLGLSRQSLYVKLRRFGMVDSASEDESAEGAK